MPDSSLAAVFSAVGEPLEMERFPLPHLTAGQLLVRVSCCTLCGSDIHTYQGRRSTPAPTVLGHEILGRVESLPPGDPVCDYRGQPLRVGDRVTWSIAASCGQCFFCRREIPQKCERVFKYGHQRIVPHHPLSGGLAEYCHLAARTAIIRVPDALPDLVACPANCATATVAAALRAGGNCGDATVLVQGAGMLGLTACAMARSLGAGEVIAADVDAGRLEIARRFGATRVVLVTGDDCPHRDPLAKVVQEATAGRGVDLALELSGAGSAVGAGLQLTRIGGHLVLVGAVFPASPVPVDAEQVVRRLLNIHGVHNYHPQDLAAAVGFLAENSTRFPFPELVTKTFPLTECEAAFAHSIRHRPLRVAVLP